KPIDPRHPDVHAPVAMDAQSDQYLFNVSNAPMTALAAQQAGPAWGYLSAGDEVALTDAVYRRAQVPTAVNTALNEPSGRDFAQAGFALFNAARPIRNNTDLLRVEAEYQDLLTAHVAQLK